MQDFFRNTSRIAAWLFCPERISEVYRVHFSSWIAIYSTTCDDFARWLRQISYNILVHDDSQLHEEVQKLLAPHVQLSFEKATWEYDSCT